jgi:hypothetical protein
MNETILRHMALAFFASAYSDQAEEAGQPLRGEIMDQLPPKIDDAALQAASTLYTELERVNGKPVEELFDILCEACEGEGDRPHTEEMFGHYAAMDAMGHGVGLRDAFGDKAGELVKVPRVEFSWASLAESYFGPDDPTYDVTVTVRVYDPERLLQAALAHPDVTPHHKFHTPDDDIDIEACLEMLLEPMKLPGCEVAGSETKLVDD